MNLDKINQRIGNRKDCFYWQTDRKISVNEAASIWSDRHSAITNEVLLRSINNELKGDELISIEPFDEKAETSLGNVNSIRIGTLKSGRRVVIRCHPKGVLNSYFHVESLAAHKALKSGIPTYKTYLIHDLNGKSDIAYQVIEKLSGHTVKTFLQSNPNSEKKLVFEMGKTMARLHKIPVVGFGPFDNEKAKNGKLEGLHSTLKSSVNAGLKENLERLVTYQIISNEVADQMLKLFENNPFLEECKPVLVHNDFADWNLLTNGETITGVIDWDECVGGHPVQEIACWSTFFDPERLPFFLEGYFSVTPQCENFDELFQLFRLRYTISKMALRVKRYNYEKSEFMASMIEKGKKHLKDLEEHYGFATDKKK